MLDRPSVKSFSRPMFTTGGSPLVDVVVVEDDVVDGLATYTNVAPTKSPTTNKAATVIVEAPARFMRS